MNDDSPAEGQGLLTDPYLMEVYNPADGGGTQPFVSCPWHTLPRTEVPAPKPQEEPPQEDSEDSMHPVESHDPRNWPIVEPCPPAGDGMQWSSQSSASSAPKPPTPPPPPIRNDVAERKKGVPSPPGQGRRSQEGALQRPRGKKSEAGKWHCGFAEAWSRGPESVFFYRAGNPHPREPIELWESWCKYIDFHEAWPDDFSTDDWKELLPPAWRKHIDSYEQELSKKSRKSCGDRDQWGHGSSGSYWDTPRTSWGGGYGSSGGTW